MVQNRRRLEANTRSVFLSAPDPKQIQSLKVVLKEILFMLNNDSLKTFITDNTGVMTIADYIFHSPDIATANSPNLLVAGRNANNPSNAK